jgi:hypothetical protein
MKMTLTSKEIFLRLVESLNQSNRHDSKDVIEIAKKQYKELRELKMFNRYPKIGEKNGN